MTTMTDERLGAELGAALRTGVDAMPTRPLNLGRVERGARRRRNRRRGTATATGLVLAIAMGWALTARSSEGQPAEPPATSPSTDPAAEARVLPVYAVDAGDEPPLMMHVDGPAPVGVPLPAVDVYRSDGETFVIRTMPPTAGSGEADDTEATVATTIADASGLTDWMGHETQPVTVRGTAGALLQLADDQWALRLPGLPEGGETVLIGRGMSSERLLALADAATAAPDGSLSIGAPWTRTEHVDAAGAQSVMVGPAAYASAGPHEPVMTWIPSVGRATAESLLLIGPPLAVVQVGRTDVLVQEGGDGRVNVTWVDSSGVAINRSIAADALDDALDSVRLIDGEAWSTLADAASTRIAAEVPEVARADVGGVTLVLRHADAFDTAPTDAADEQRLDADALCLRAHAGDDTEQCQLEWSFPDKSSSFDASFLVDGEWILAGYRSAAENPYGDTGDVRFTSADGTCCEVEWAAQGDGRWYVVRVPAGIDVVTTGIGDEFDGPVGDLYRPPTVGG